MGRLSAAQETAIASGAAVRQIWKVYSPTSSTHAAYIPTTFDGGQYSAAVPPRVVRAGSRKVKVWNPHPSDDDAPSAPRYSFEVDNSDGYFYTGSGNAWNVYGLYAADPTECRISHEIQVWLGSGWSTLSFLSYLGRVVEVNYTEAAAADKSATGSRCVITCEQAGAWDVLRRVFTKDDGDLTEMNDGVDDVGWTVT